MKLLLLVCVSLVAGTPILQKRSGPISVYDYYDFVEIPRSRPIATSRSDGPMVDPVARSSGPLPRRISMPLPQKRRPQPPPPKKRNPINGNRPQKPRPFREPDYQLAQSEIIKPQFRPRPKPQQTRQRPQFQPRPQRQPVRVPEPQFYDYEELPTVYADDPLYPVDESVFIEEPQYPRESPLYLNERPVIGNPEPTMYMEDLHKQYQEERRQHQEERRPQYQEERQPQYQEERQPQYQEERQPQYQGERRPQYQDELRPEYQNERLPVYQEERPPFYQEERPPFYQEEPMRQHEPSEKDINRPALNNYRTTQDKEAESVKEKRDAIHDGGGGHLDENGLKFAANAAAVENAKGAGRLAFQIHGQQGPHSYRFGYDTGKGENRQFRYEERDGDGLVHGRYGFYDEYGKLQVTNYSAHPEHGFSADVPKN